MELGVKGKFFQVLSSQHLFMQFLKTKGEKRLEENTLTEVSVEDRNFMGGACLLFLRFQIF